MAQLRAGMGAAEAWVIDQRHELFLWCDHHARGSRPGDKVRPIALAPDRVGTPVEFESLLLIVTHFCLEACQRNPDARGVGQTPFAILDFGQVQVQIQVRPITVQNLRGYLEGETARIKALVAQRDSAAPRKAVIVVDGSVSLMPPVEARAMQRAWFNQNHDLLRLVAHRMGFVLPNPFLRGFVSAVFYLASPPVPMVTHGSLLDAIDWAIREAHAIQGQVSAELLSDRVAAVERARTRALASIAPPSRPHL